MSAFDLREVSRRTALVGVAGYFAASTLAGCSTPRTQTTSRPATAFSDNGDRSMSKIITKDGAEIYYKDWGSGQPVVFSHGWPLSSDAFEDQMFFLASRGFRAIGHDRRGHGRSSQPWQGNDLDTYADDLAELVTQL